jgi:DNA-binding transcriptional MocR family regulator
MEELQQRWRLAARVLGPRMPQGRAVAPHLWLDDSPPAGLAEACRDHGVEVVAAEVFAVDANPGHAVRVSLAAAASRAELKRALEGIVAAWPL